MSRRKKPQHYDPRNPRGVLVEAHGISHAHIEIREGYGVAGILKRIEQLDAEDRARRALTTPQWGHGAARVKQRDRGVSGT